MKVAIIIEQADTMIGGAERSIMELAASLRIAGIDVSVLIAKGGMNVKYFKFMCNDRPGRRITHKSFGAAIEKHLAANHYDIVHSTLPFGFADIYQPRGGCYKESIIRNAASCRSNFLFHWQTLTHWFNRHRYDWLKAEQELCKGQHKTIIAALSDYVREQYVRHYGTDESRIVVIHNGVKIHKDIKKDAVDNMRHNLLLKLRLKEADEPVFYLFAANNFRLKGLASAIEALGELNRRDVENRAYLLIAGSGNTQKYRSLANSLGVGDRVMFLGQLKDVQTVMRVTDVNILPTFYDPSSRITLEALSTPVPVITTSLDGSSEMFVNNRHGIVIDDPENTIALADAMEHYLDEKARNDAIEAITADKLEESISIERHTRQMIELYEKIIAGKLKV